jgi:hypothetical protein
MNLGLYLGSGDVNLQAAVLRQCVGNGIKSDLQASTSAVDNEKISARHIEGKSIGNCWCLSVHGQSEKRSRGLLLSPLVVPKNNDSRGDPDTDANGRG